MLVELLPGVQSDQIRLSSDCIPFSSVCVSGAGEERPRTPTAMESVLPWKRQDDEGLVLKQNEFPAWASNKEYLAYNSPSATFLGKSPEPAICGLLHITGSWHVSGAAQGQCQSHDTEFASRLQQQLMDRLAGWLLGEGVLYVC